MTEEQLRDAISNLAESMNPHAVTKHVMLLGAVKRHTDTTPLTAFMSYLQAASMEVFNLVSGELDMEEVEMVMANAAVAVLTNVVETSAESDCTCGFCNRARVALALAEAPKAAVN